jgi:hypothetical protein
MRVVDSTVRASTVERGYILVLFFGKMHSLLFVFTCTSSTLKPRGCNRKGPSQDTGNRITRSGGWTLHLGTWLSIHAMADQYSISNVISNALAMRESLGVLSLNSTVELKLPILSLGSPVHNVFRWEEHVPLKYHSSGTSTN